MAHFAKIGLNNKVIDVCVVHNDELKDSEGNEDEVIGVQFLVEHTKYPHWVQTSYNHNFRGRYATIGGTWDEENDRFIPRQPYPSWTLNEETIEWEAPTEKPDDGKGYDWNEETTSWDEKTDL